MKIIQASLFRAIMNNTQHELTQQLMAELFNKD